MADVFRETGELSVDWGCSGRLGTSGKFLMIKENRGVLQDW